MNINFFTNPTETPKFDGPLIVLIDGGSASASEIVTGAIKNNQRVSTKVLSFQVPKLKK